MTGMERLVAERLINYTIEPYELHDALQHVFVYGPVEMRMKFDEM